MLTLAARSLDSQSRSRLRSITRSKSFDITAASGYQERTLDLVRRVLEIGSKLLSNVRHILAEDAQHGIVSGTLPDEETRTATFEENTESPLILIVVATEVELDSVLKASREHSGVDAKQITTANRTYFDLGTVGGARCMVVQTEMGSSSVGGSLSTTLTAIGELQARAVILTGIAFGVDDVKQSIGQLVISKQILCYELQRVGRTRSGHKEVVPRGDKCTAPPRLLSRFRSSGATWSGSKVHFGLILSGEKLIDDFDYREQLKSLFPEAIGGEMEGAGVYAAAREKNIDWIVVKAICDFADGRKRKNKKARQKTAAMNSARFVMRTISQGGVAA